MKINRNQLNIKKRHIQQDEEAYGFHMPKQNLFLDSNVLKSVVMKISAEDGQHIYLHSLNARCMVHTYGSWEKCPERITAKIIELEAVSMNQVYRNSGVVWIFFKDFFLPM